MSEDPGEGEDPDLRCLLCGTPGTVRATPKVRAEVGAEDLAWAVEAIGRAESLALEVAS